MTETTFTFRLDDELKAAFAETARSQDRTAAQLLRVLMREAVQSSRARHDHDRWFVGEVEAALEEADDPRTEWVSNDQARADWADFRAALLLRQKDEDSKRSAAE